MLSVKQQKFIIKLLEKNVTKATNNLYGSRAFYRTITYLKNNNIVQSRRNKNGVNEYYLTIKGNALARLLAGLTDADPEMNRKYGLK